jgi:hypothetical protein
MPCVALCLVVSGWLTLHGFAPPQRDAVLRNIYLESRFEPCVTRGPNGSAYLLQWLGPRRRALIRFTNAALCPAWSDQLQFMMTELQAPKFATFWKTKSASIAYREMRERFGKGK